MPTRRNFTAAAVKISVSNSLQKHSQTHHRHQVKKGEGRYYRKLRKWLREVAACRKHVCSRRSRFKFARPSASANPAYGRDDADPERQRSWLDGAGRGRADYRSYFCPRRLRNPQPDTRHGVAVLHVLRHRGALHAVYGLQARAGGSQSRSILGPHHRRQQCLDWRLLGLGWVRFFRFRRRAKRWRLCLCRC